VFPSVVAPDAPTTVATFLLRKFLAGPRLLGPVGSVGGGAAAPAAD
jgi:hypothetical protein